jgi:hypothetical protein
MCMKPLVALIVSQPGMAARLIRAHIDDGSGHCKVCAIGGQAGHLVWPCPIRLEADEAAAVLERTATVQMP